MFYLVELVLNDTSPMLPVENILDISMLVFVVLSIAFMLISWYMDGGVAVVSAGISTITWFVTGLYWIWEKAGTEAVHFFYVFEMLALVSVITVISKAMALHELSGKKGAWR